MHACLLSLCFLYFSLVCALLRGEECSRSCILYGLTQIVHDVTSRFFFPIVSSFKLCAHVEMISVVPGLTNEIY